MRQIKRYDDLTIVIPTLNERGNIGHLLNKLLKLYPKIKIITVDDGSTDGTEDEVRLISKYNPNVVFLAKPNKSIRGITASVIYGLRQVTTSKMIVMDGDLQHPVNKVGEISDSLDRFDIVVGIRISVKEWGIYRRIVSFAVSKFVILIFKIKGYKTCKDMMSGFFGIRTNMFRGFVSKYKNRYVMEGYKVFLDTLKLSDSNVSMTEVPYKTFHRRKKGISKTNVKVLLNIIRSCFR